MIPSFTRKDKPIMQQIFDWDDFKYHWNNTSDRFIALLFWVGWHPPCDDFKLLFKNLSKGLELEFPEGKHEDTPKIFGTYLWWNTDEWKPLFKKCLKLQIHQEGVDVNSSGKSMNVKRQETVSDFGTGAYDIKGKSYSSSLINLIK